MVHFTIFYGGRRGMLGQASQYFVGCRPPLTYFVLNAIMPQNAIPNDHIRRRGPVAADPFVILAYAFIWHS